MQRNKSSVSEDENVQIKRNYCEIEPDTDWLLPLLWNNGQFRKYNGIPIQHHEKTVLLSESEKLEEKL